MKEFNFGLFPAVARPNGEVLRPARAFFSWKGEHKEVPLTEEQYKEGLELWLEHGRADKAARNSANWDIVNTYKAYVDAAEKWCGALLGGGEINEAAIVAAFEHIYKIDPIKACKVLERSTSSLTALVSRDWDGFTKEEQQQITEMDLNEHEGEPHEFDLRLEELKKILWRAEQKKKQEVGDA